MKRRTFAAWFAGLFAWLMGATAVANPVHAQLSALSESSRALAFARLLQAGGEKCASVSRTFHQGNDQKGNAFWNAQCSGGPAYQIMVASNTSGSTRYLDCAFMKRLNAGQCFVKFKA